MKWFIFVLTLVIVPSISFSQSDVIALYGDTEHIDCDIPWRFGIIPVYVFHYSATGATGCSFKAPWQDCLIEVVYYRDFRVFPNTVGNSQTGITINYGACLTGWIGILRIDYADWYGLGFPNCCELPVFPHPNSSSGEIEVTNCNDAILFAVGVSGIAEQDSLLCPCDIPTGIADAGFTWGRIKALYE